MSDQAPKTGEGGSPQAAEIRDPLLEEERSFAQKALSSMGGLVGAVIVHVVGAFLLMTLAPMCNVEHVEEDVEEDSIVEVAVQEPEPQPAEPPPPPPEPEPEPEPEPAAPEPEPEPEPVEPQPRPEPQPDPEPVAPEPEPSDNEPPPEESPQEAESMNPVHLEGLTADSMSSSSDAPAFKQGTGIKSGKVSGKYVDPDRMGSIKTGKGDGEGYGSGDKPAASGSQPSGGPTRKPKPVFKAKADPSEYPVAAKRRGIGGEIVAIVTVDAGGKVVDVKIVKGLGHGLDELAEKVFRKWRFEAALDNGRPVRDTIRVRHTFEVTDY